MTKYIFYPWELCIQNANASIPTEVNNVSILNNVLCGNVLSLSEEISNNKITHYTEAVTHTNFLLPLRGISCEICKLGHIMI